jgi:hypothetical protein
VAAPIPAAPAAPDWSPTPDDVARLGDAGRGLLTRVLRDVTVTPLGGLKLLAAAAIEDRLAASQAVDRTGLSPSEIVALDRNEQGWRTLQLRHLNALEPRR